MDPDNKINNDRNAFGVDATKITRSTILLEQGGLTYHTGFGNTLESECVPDALPIGRNNPKIHPLGLYTEQLSGTAFTAPRKENQRVWLYRIQPSVVVGPTTPLHEYFGGTDPRDCHPQINPLRWNPMPVPDNKDFVSGMNLLCTAGDPGTKNGLSIYMYGATKSMESSMYNADGEFLIVPQEGSLEIITELGKLRASPREICVIPRGIVFQIHLLQSVASRGYVLEVYSGVGFQLPELGPIGSNGLANARDFLYPTANCVKQAEYNEPHIILCKMESKLYQKRSLHSPYNVVAWHGNYLPYKYSLERFCAVNSVTYDHLDPSIYTVLTCPTDHAGTALADFVIFPPRYMSTDSNTFRPPWFHRNTMSEFMGLIYGSYDAKKYFLPGGATLHNCMTPHGPDKHTFEKATSDPCEKPAWFDAGLAFMFETCLPLKVSPQCLSWQDENYMDCWQQLDAAFTGWHLMEN